MIDILTQKLQSCIIQDAWNSDDSDNPDLLILLRKILLSNGQILDTSKFKKKKLHSMIVI